MAHVGVSAITPERVQQLLQENAQFILAIYQNQNAGNLEACYLCVSLTSNYHTEHTHRQ